MKVYNSFDLTKEDDGVKAKIEVNDDYIVSSVSFNISPLTPLVLSEENLKEMKSEIDSVLKGVREAKKHIKVIKKQK